jgi:hypothetical protein
MAYLFLAALAVVLLILFLQKLERADVKLIVQTLKWTAVGVMVLAAFYLTLVGRLVHVAALLVLLVILLKQDMAAWFKKKPSPLSLSRPMTKKEAASLLNVKVGARVEDIEAAFKQAKPRDSTERDRLSQAREVLLKGQNPK